MREVVVLEPAAPRMMMKQEKRRGKQHAQSDPSDTFHRPIIQAFGSGTFVRPRDLRGPFDRPEQTLAFQSLQSGRRQGISKLKIKEMGSRYLFMTLYCRLEKYFSCGDYKRL